MAPSALDLPHQAGSTRIFLGARALAAASSDLATWLAGRRVFVVSSAAVRELHRDRLAPLFSEAVEVVDLEVPDGESSKSLATVERLAREMVRAAGKRDSRLVTLGGGTVGDVGGFAAGCFLRGIEYAQIPTTLLAQVDAAIGGKTGVNLPEAKNSVGVFHQPRWVICDPSFLGTLPAEETRQGMFEVVKAAILADPELFVLIESDLEAIVSGERSAALAEVVARAVAVKVAIVAADERERGRRRLLNLGHTLGHALETVSGHGRLRHGDAVGHGIVFAAALARSRGLSRGDEARIRALIERMNPAPLSALDRGRVLVAIGRDKKARESGIGWVLPINIGQAEVAEISMAAVEYQLESFFEEFVE